MIDKKTLELEAKLREIINGTPANNSNAERKPAQGREYAHSLYPKEIEYYACALELVDGNGIVIEMFAFPIMPKMMSTTELTNTSIDKTMSGVVVNTNPTFVPIDIVLQGSFGKSFKRVKVGDDELKAGSGGVVKSGIQNTFDDNYKTGYGCYKILENILRQSKTQDANYNPYKLYFYNLTKSDNYLVEVISISPSQNRDSSNMIWEYSLTLKAVAPASAVNKNYKSSLKLLMDYQKLNKIAIFQAEEIKQFRPAKTTRQISKVEEIFQRQAKGRVGGLFGSQKSALQAMLQLTQNPRDIDDFALNVGEGILNRF